MKHTLISFSAKALAVVSLVASISIAGQAFPAAAAVAAHPVQVKGAVAPTSGAEALALCAVTWHSAETPSVALPALSAVGHLALQTVDAHADYAVAGNVIEVAPPAESDALVGDGSDSEEV